jgi:hypothetical protein
MRNRRHRSRVISILAEALEPRQLFSMAMKLPVLPLAENAAQAPAVAAPAPEPTGSYAGDAIDLNAIDVPVGAPFTRKLLTLSGTNVRYAIPSEVRGAAKVYQAHLTWGDGSQSLGEFRRTATGDVEVWGTHTYAAAGRYDVGVHISVVHHVPAGHDPSEYAWTAEVPHEFQYALTIRAGEVVTQATTQASLPAGLTVLPVKTTVVVGETTGGVLTVISGSAYRLPSEEGTGGYIRAVINWGDGTYEEATLSRALNDILVSGFHAYGKPGQYHAIVTLIPFSNDPLALVPPPTDISNTLFTVTLNSANGQILKTRTGQSFNGTIATIPNFGAFPKSANKAGDLTLARPASGSNPQAAIKATIAWGDGTVSSGYFKSNKSGGYDIVGTHRYAAEGTYRTQVFIDVAYNGGPFVGTIQQIDGLALVGSVPGNLPYLPNLTFPLTNFTQQAGVTGQLVTGLAAIGGETTGAEVRGASFTYELEFTSSALKAKAEALNGKNVIVGGILTIRPGIEIAQRRILTVSVLEQA